METKYKELIERVRLIDLAAAEYLEDDARNLSDFQPHEDLGSIMVWDKTPQGLRYWRNIADTLDKTSWKAREQARMDNGIYEPVNLAGDDLDRFLHVSLLNPDMVAYTKNDEKGQADIQTKTTLEAYIRKFRLETTGHVPSKNHAQPKVVIEVRGGVITSVISDSDLDIRLVDYNTPENGDPTLGRTFDDGSFISELIASGRKVY